VAVAHVGTVTRPRRRRYPSRLVAAGIGRDDDVRPVALDQPQQRSCSEQGKARPPQPTERRQASEEAIEAAEDPGSEVQLPAVGIEQEEAEKPAQPTERVADQDLDVCSLADKLGRERPSCGGVSLPYLSGEDDDAQLRLAPSRLIARGAVGSDDGRRAERATWPEKLAVLASILAPGQAPLDHDRIVRWRT
jgi:hypothetical protein